MKLKIIRVFILFGVVFLAASCTSDETDIQTGNRPDISDATAPSLQVKKITQVTYYGSSDNDTDVTDFIYSRNRLIGLHSQYDTGETYDSEILYDGIKIIQINQSHNGVVNNPIFITYTDDKITSSTSNVATNRTDFTYNNGFLRTIKGYMITSGVDQLTNREDYTYQFGNVTGLIKTDYYFSSPPSHIMYTYDNRNSPLKGMNKYFRLIYSNEGFDGLSLNNPLTRAYYSEGSQQNITTQHYIIEYNNNNYPTNIKRLSVNNSLISDTTIEYR